MSIRLHVPVTPAIRREAARNQAVPQSLCLTVRLGRDESSLLPGTLSLALGHDVEVFAMACNAAGKTTLQIHVARSELDALMNVIMTEIPQAEFGFIQPLASTAVH
jgi:hypothetical protein